MDGMLNESHLGRRHFLKGAGLLAISFSLSGAMPGLGRAAPAAPKLGPYGPAPDELDSWIAIDTAGFATLYTGVCELGTGSHTALLQVMAEELDVAFDHAKLQPPDTNRTPDQFVSSGSRSIAYHAVPIRQAAAEARHALVAMAAEKLKVPAEQLVVENGVVSVAGAPGKRISYGQLIGGRQFDLKVTGTVKPKDPSLHKIVGTPAQRIDIPGKVTGSFTFAQDVKVPGMLHGRVIRPPAHGASVIEIDESSIAHLPGVVKIVRKADLVGVVCHREEEAIEAARQLKVSWSAWADLPDMKDIHQKLREVPIYAPGIPAKYPGGVIAKDGDVESALAGAAKAIKATYASPYHLHGSIGPSCAVADVRPDGVTIWSATQTAYGLREAAAKFLGLTNDKVRLIFAEGAGCYGQNGADDVVIDALVMSQAVGKPVRVQWMRADETGWETYKTARVTDLRGGLDADGKIVAWESNAWGFSGYSRPEYHEPKQGGEPGSLVTAQLAGWTTPGLEEGFNGIALESAPNYAVGSKHVVFNYLGPASHRQGPIRMRVGSMRGVGSPDNVFMVESFIDELAAAAGADPVEFRLKHLSDPRTVAVVKAATERAGWQPRPAHSAPAQDGDVSTGRGIALFGGGKETHIASIFEVEVNRKSGAIRVKKVTVAHDCGLIVNPDGVRNQIEGGVIQGISRGLMEEVTFDRSRVTSLDWASYPIITFPDVPDEIDIVLISRPDLPAVGVGEASTKNVWAGIANAVFDATGVRLRRMPFTPERFKAALAEQA
jgi:CO/xanthine dehydrogenase Mo-binding subunit